MICMRRIKCICLDLHRKQVVATKKNRLSLRPIYNVLSNQLPLICIYHIHNKVEFFQNINCAALCRTTTKYEFTNIFQLRLDASSERKYPKKANTNRTIFWGWRMCRRVWLMSHFEDRRTISSSRWMLFLSKSDEIVFRCLCSAIFVIMSHHKFCPILEMFLRSLAEKRRAEQFIHRLNT